MAISALHRGAPDESAMDRVWYQAEGFWLEREPPPAEVAGSDQVSIRRN
jgi:hypothetical protein